MSTVQKVNFEPVSDLLATQRRDFTLADPDLADPTNAVALVDGEWMVINGTYKAVRASAIGSVGDPATQTGYVLFAERGRYDVQAMAQRKMPLIFMGDYEADTRIFDASVAIGSGAVIATAGQPLKVATITIGSRNYTGLVGHGGASDPHPIVGRVTRLPAVNGGKLRYVRASNI
jgi:hypothetical protein